MVERSIVADVLDIIASELGIGQDDLQDGDTTWQEVGMDPIMAKSIVAKVAQKTGLELKSNTFDSFPDVDSFRSEIQALAHKRSTEESNLSQAARPDAGNGGVKPSLSVLIQNTAPAAAQTPQHIFLLPDGSGSAMAYARLKITHPGTKIIALNSPFLTTANQCTVSIEQIAETFTDEILHLQPSGPYTLGGWSAGGFYAYEVMKALQRRGEVVARLVLIDSPCRTDFGALPVDVLRYLAEKDLMGNWGGRGAAAPEWLLEHFEASLKAVDVYVPVAVGAKETMTKVFIIWAEDPLLSPELAAGSGLDLRVKVSRFLLAGRDDFGPNGWDKLLPRSCIRIARMPGHHFSVVHPPYVDSLGSLVSDVLEEDEVKRKHVWVRA